MATDPREYVVRNALLLQRLSNALEARAEGVVRALYDEIVTLIARIDPTGPALPRYRRGREKQLLEEIARRVAPAYEELRNIVRNGDPGADVAGLSHIGRDYAERSALQLEAMLGAGGEGMVTSPRLSLARARAIVDAEPLEGALLRDWFRDQGKRTAFRVSQQIKLGVARSEPLAEIVRRVRGRSVGRGRYAGGAMETSTREATSIVRTAVNDIANRAAQETQLANLDIAPKFQIVATLDSRTSPICRARDGEVHPAEQRDAPRPPFHVNCRTITVPVIDWEGIGLKRPPTGSRASAQGQVSADTTYEEWLRGRPRREQDEILGPARAALFRDGRVTLRDLVRSDGGTVKLSQLKLQEPEQGPFDLGSAKQKLSTGALQTSDLTGASIDQVDELIHDAPIEHAAVYGGDGQLRFYTTSGMADQVGFSPGQLAQMKNGRLTHNHPKGSSFSDADIALAHHRDVAEVRAVSPWYHYTIERPDGGWTLGGPAGTIHAAISAAYDAALDEIWPSYKAKIDAGLMTSAEAWREASHHVVLRLAEQYSFRYTRTPWSDVHPD